MLLDRAYICAEIGKADQIPASTFVCQGVLEPDGSYFASNAGRGGGRGYFDASADAFEANHQEAVSILSKYYDYDGAAFTNFPPLAYLYNDNEHNKAIGEYLQTALSSVGIEVSMESQEWSVFLETRQNGEYSIARDGWIMDYNDPVCMLEMWTSQSENDDVQLGKGDHAHVAAYDIDITDYGYDLRVEGGTWAETYDG